MGFQLHWQLTGDFATVLPNCLSNMKVIWQFWHPISLFHDFMKPFSIGRPCIYISHWGRVMHICIGKQTIIGSDNGLSPGRHQAIIWTDAGILLFGPLGTNFSEISIKIQTFSFTKMCLKVSSAKWRPFCLGPNVLNNEAREPLHSQQVTTIISPGNHSRIAYKVSNSHYKKSSLTLYETSFLKL